MPDVYDNGRLVARDVGGGHLQDQNGVCIVCIKCDDLWCCNRPATCEGEHAKVSAPYGGRDDA
jgi:hypothetical protein